jgi:O-antigen ligase
VATLATCRRLGPEDRQLLLDGVTAAGLVVALTGWLGVAWRVDSLAWLGDGIWRASATLTYPNAAAAVLAPLALVALARLDRSPPPLLVVTATALLGGLAATLSRAGAVAFVVGLAVLAYLRGPRATVRAAAGPCAGAVVILAGLVPSMPAAAPPRPVAAVAALGGLVLVAGGPGAGEALGAVAEGRISLASPDRTGALQAARQVVADHPLTGAGPGHTQLRSEGPDGATRFFAYAHNEYAQVAAELGLVGLALLVALLAALARLLWRSRPAGNGLWAGVVAAAAAFAVHAGFGFVWHLPAVVLAVTVLVGAALPAPVPNPPVPAPPRKELYEATT